ncbi:ubiquinol oxidase subunit II [Hydrogenophaga sp. BPS33]|uniref:ubiquinol oxidase subunit II n=1 Tax=Hydrogenophaga sp. BPS33 TaxID=2651974 RepID=UPI001320261B|nr:ubiquinol oxidase subunit II [Hydrogenophaga sp. BPS33]QHE85389.1 ubiquinol oxidase subunit II [Hydrogenophaga sp. BPS33]
MRLTALFRGSILLMLASFLAGCSKLVVLNPAGDIAAQQGQLVVIATVLMLLIIVPVIFLIFLFAWRYRQGSQRAETDYAPDWDHSTKLELVIWAAPLMIIIALGALTWITTHKLDPYRPLDRISAGKSLPADVKPLEVQVVSLDWKWLFILPEQGIATVNELAAPVDRPIRFKLTSSTTMNAFYVPDLAGMIYTMPGMQTELNAIINKPGVFQGMSSHYSGAGFSGMTFKFHGMSEEGFAQWVDKARASGQTLSREAYLALAKPSERDPVARFASVDESLYRRVLNLCVEEGKACMHEVMAQDARRNRAHAAGVALAAASGQSVCTASESFDLLNN